MNEIQVYVEKQRALGSTDEQIKQNLLNNGHAEDSLRHYFSSVSGGAGLDDQTGVILYSYWNIVGAAFLGGPLAVTYMVQKNYEAWNEPELARQARKIGVLGTVGALVLLDMIFFFMPADSDASFGFAIGMAAFAVAQHYQGVRLKEHKAQQGSFMGFWKSLAVTLVSIMATLPIAILSVLAVPFILSSLGFVSG